MTPTILFTVAGLIAALWFFYHLIAGRKEVVIPMRKTPAIDPIVRDTLHLVWHFVTASLAFLASLFLLAAVKSSNDFAMAGTILAWGFTIVGTTLVLNLGGRFRDLPQGLLFLPIALLGTAGLVL